MTGEIDDKVYGKVKIDNKLIKPIMQTKPFQRLTKIGQLGSLPFIFVNCKYSRSEHCIGTFLMASKMLTALERNSDWKQDDCYTKLCRPAVQVAALLHDIGHGPFSHSWERVFENFNGAKYKHESVAEPCIDEVFKELKEANVEPDYDSDIFIELVKCLVRCKLKRFLVKMPDFPTRYQFIFEIVKNKKCFFDVDKLDYLRRDASYSQGRIHINDNLEDAFMMARVSESGEHIEYRYEDYDKIYALFEQRARHHRFLYRFPKATIIDKLLTECIQRCEQTINGKKLMDIRPDNDMEAFYQLTDDNVLTFIKDDKMFKYLQNPDSIMFVNKEQADPQNYVEEIIDGAGTTMPPDEHFSFYGDSCNKPSVERDMQPQRIAVYYKFL